MCLRLFTHTHTLTFLPHLRGCQLREFECRFMIVRGYATAANRWSVSMKGLMCKVLCRCVCELLVYLWNGTVSGRECFDFLSILRFISFREEVSVFGVRLPRSFCYYAICAFSHHRFRSVLDPFGCVFTAKGRIEDVTRESDLIVGRLMWF